MDITFPKKSFGTQSLWYLWPTRRFLASKLISETRRPLLDFIDLSSSSSVDIDHFCIIWRRITFMSWNISTIDKFQFCLKKGTKYNLKLSLITWRNNIVTYKEYQVYNNSNTMQINDFSCRLTGPFCLQ